MTAAGPSTMEQMLKAVVPLVLIMGFRMLPFEESQLLVGARVAFAIRIICTALFAGFIWYRAREVNDQTVIKAHEKSLPGGQTEVVPEMTAQDYDIKELVDFLKGQGIQIAMLAFVHYQWNIVQPLIITSFMFVMPIYESPLFQLYLLNKTNTIRPFIQPEPTGIAALFQPAASEASATGIAKKKD